MEYKWITKIANKKRKSAEDRYNLRIAEIFVEEFDRQIVEIVGNNVEYAHYWEEVVSDFLKMISKYADIQYNIQDPAKLRIFIENFIKFNML
ncbi:MAG TPA: hypothetical protein VHA52_13600 [Candidatus Babeliaceae bacterium]|nr:hypothetical protein [Candidatus Babeliaceae bacterium]